jgi:hypothetical protein
VSGFGIDGKRMQRCLCYSVAPAEPVGREKYSFDQTVMGDNIFAEIGAGWFVKTIGGKMFGK